MPVMVCEVINGLQVKPEGIYVDCTFGGGGHSKAILSALGSKGRLFAFDQDEDAKESIPGDVRFTFIPHNFGHLQRFLRLHKITQVDGVLADLGISSHQVDEAERGFSFRFDAPLDMRMDQRQELTAAKVVTKYPEERLHKIFEQYGEVTNAKTLAKIIVETRSSASLQSIPDFKKMIHPVVKGNPNKYFAQVFQALRIEVNNELGSLKEMLKQLPGILHAGARVAVITFHSLEDRVVKNFFKYGNLEEVESDEVYGTKPEKVFNIITRKPMIAGKEEIEKNSRARSAKLRIAERC